MPTAIANSVCDATSDPAIRARGIMSATTSIFEKLFRYAKQEIEAKPPKKMRTLHEILKMQRCIRNVISKLQCTN